ncbi:MAG TPA: transglutaminase-like cysteine peptidase [Aquabacterium sp.]|nr:transglutaminase-like cysteine peptidase [Aquabacterium sp.]
MVAARPVMPSISAIFSFLHVRLATGRSLVRFHVFWQVLLCPLVLLALLPSNALDGPRLLTSAQRIGPQAVHRTQALLKEMAQAGDDEVAKLKAVNSFFNRHVQYAEDRDVWGQVDHWTTPLELLGRGAGDCEDFAIAKYFSLIAMGMAPAKMRMVYVRAQNGGVVQAHMVLAYYPEPDAEPLILDNLITDMRPASRRPDLAPVFSFNAEGLWQGVGPSAAGDPVARLSRWRDVLNKAKTEGWW